MGNELTIGKQNMVAKISEYSVGNLIKPLTKEILLLETYVAGTTHIKDESAFDDVKVGTNLILQREPGNRFDEKAILVLGKDKKKMGYVPEKDNVILARLMDAGKCLIAKIDKYEPQGSFRQINISVYMVDF